MANDDRRSGRLEPYRTKRSADASPEPFGRQAALRPGVFAVQQHAARRLHYDLRLELDGVLLSWAVPRGPSLDPAEKRLAVQTEDHPLEYADFEGLIPEGNYGAGAMILWDRGRWVPKEEPGVGLDRGKLLFDLEGYKLRGLWTLVRTQRDPKEWLLIKKPDGWATDDDILDSQPTSILSGLTVGELAEGHHRAEELRHRLEQLGAPRNPVDPTTVRPMLAELAKRAFSRPEWIFELKYDGYRMLAAVQPTQATVRPAADRTRMFLRSGQEAGASFPELRRSLAAQPWSSLLLDGEVVVLDDEARPSFSRLQRRAGLRRRHDIERATVDLPAIYYAFDLLAFEDFDLRPLPLRERKALLRQVLPGAGPLRYADHVEERGRDLYRQVRRQGLEGIVAKDLDSPYRSRRSREWIKIRCEKVDDFVVVGFTAPKGSRTGFGALHLAQFDGDDLVYAGRVGTGFSGAVLDELTRRLAPLARQGPAAGIPDQAGRGHSWVEPRLVVEVRFTELTDAGLVRHPVFLRLREDKPATECRRQSPGDRELPSPSSSRTPPREVPLARLGKVFWPADEITKGDLIDYYRAISPWLLPYLRDRPVVLVRYPDGVEGKSFFQKNAPEFTPDWLRVETVWSEDAQRETDYFVCDDLQSLLYLVNMGTIPLHIWSSRIASLQRPDWSILDLDPKEAPFSDVVRVAREIRALCREIRLPCYVKTSGGSGLHVLIPLAGQMSYSQSRQLASVLARIVSDRLPEIATLERTLAARGGRVYLDWVQNGHGRLLIAPFSARPFPGAPVSTPLRWREVGPRLRPDRHTIRSVPQRMSRMKSEPLVPVLEEEVDLLRVLERLSDRL